MTGQERTLIRRENGYDICTQVLENGTLEAAYTPEGLFIGDEGDAKFLIERGIKPEIVPNSDHSVCSIGFCEREAKWYGWSHRAIYGFGPGSEVKRGDCGYRPTDKEDFRRDCIRFWESALREHVWGLGGHSSSRGSDGVLVCWRYSQTVPNESLRGKTGEDFTPYPDTWGRGEWTAVTLDDAKQMAVDFAESVS